MSPEPGDTRQFFLLDALLLSSLMVGVRSTYRALDYLQQRDNVTGAAALIYGAGRGGQLVLHELLQNPRFGLRPIGFLDDDPRLQGLRVNGMPIRGAVADLNAIIKAQSVSYLIVAARYIHSDHLQQALSVCQERRIPILHAHLKLEPVIPEPGRAKPSYTQLSLTQQRLRGRVPLPSGMAKASRVRLRGEEPPLAIAGHNRYTLTVSYKIRPRLRAFGAGILCRCIQS